MGCPWSTIWCTVSPPDLWLFPPLWEWGNYTFWFSNSILLSLLFLFLGEPFLGMVLGSMGFTFWGNPGGIISLHYMKGTHCWYQLLIPTEPPSLSIEYVNPLKRFKNNCSSSGHSLEAKLFFTGPESGTFFYHTSKIDFKLIVIPTWINK